MHLAGRPEACGLQDVVESCQGNRSVRIAVPTGERPMQQHPRASERLSFVSGFGTAHFYAHALHAVC